MLYLVVDKRLFDQAASEMRISTCRPAERERADVVAEINTLRSMQSGEIEPIKVVPSGNAGDPTDRNSPIEKKLALFRRLFACVTTVPFPFQVRRTDVVGRGQILCRGAVLHGHFGTAVQYRAWSK